MSRAKIATAPKIPISRAEAGSEFRAGLHSGRPSFGSAFIRISPHLRLEGSVSDSPGADGFRIADGFVLSWLRIHVSGGPMHKLALLVLVTALQFGAADSLVAADPRIGSWTLVSAQSSIDPPNKLSITSKNRTVHVVISGDTHVDFTAKLDGHESSVQGNPAFNQIEVRRIDKHQVDLIEKKDGAVVTTIHDKLSKDGNELTSTTVQNGRAD